MISRATPTCIARITLLSALAFVAPGDLHAQRNTATSPTLASVDSMLARSHFREASEMLGAWERAHTSKVSPADRATALMLHARMASTGDSARTLYLELSASYPSSPEAPVALMRLGQIAVADNDTLRAISYFQRVARDYPNTDAAADAREWRAKLEAQPAPPRADVSRQETKPRDPNPRESKPRESNTRESDTRESNTRGAFTLQIGAFKEASTASTVAKRLIRLGFEPRVVTIPGSTLSRVRVGRFATSRASDDLLRRLRAGGYEAVVVDDAAREIKTTR